MVEVRESNPTNPLLWSVEPAILAEESGDYILWLLVYMQQTSWLVSKKNCILGDRILFLLRENRYSQFLLGDENPQVFSHKKKVSQSAHGETDWRIQHNQTCRIYIHHDHPGIRLLRQPSPRNMTPYLGRILPYRTRTQQDRPLSILNASRQLHSEIISYLWTDALKHVKIEISPQFDEDIWYRLYNSQRSACRLLSSIKDAVARGFQYLPLDILDTHVHLLAPEPIEPG